jgi:urease accessory protein UreH
LTPATTTIQATNEDGKTIDLTVDGNLTIDWIPQANITAEPATYSQTSLFCCKDGSTAT